MDEKSVIEKICEHADNLIREGRYEDNVQQLLDFAAKHLGVTLTAKQLDRLVKAHMVMDVMDTRSGKVIDSAPYKSMVDYIAKRRVQIRTEEHAKEQRSYRPEGPSISNDSSLRINMKGTEYFPERRH